MKFKIFIILILIIFLFNNIKSQEIVKSGNKNTYLLNVLQLKAIGNGYTDNTYVSFNQNATQNYDNQYDVLKLFGINAAPQIYSIINDTLPLSINTVPFPVNNYIVQIGFNVGKDTTYIIKAIGVDSFPSFPVIFLEDTKNSLFINLSQQSTYSFNASTTDSINRFKLHFTSSTPSPLINNSGNIKFVIFNHKLFIYNNKNEFITKSELYEISGKLIHTANHNTDGNIIINLPDKFYFYIVNIFTYDRVYCKKIIIN